MRVALVAVTACVALGLAGPVRAAERIVERGIVQAIDRQSVVLRALDGTDVTVPLGPSTRFRLNGREARFGAIRVGFVAEAVVAGSGPALVLRAFGTPVRVVRGTLVRVGLAAVVVRRPSGRLTRIRLARGTTVWRDGLRIRLRALRLGMVVEVERAADGTAAAIRVLRRS